MCRGDVVDRDWMVGAWRACLELQLYSVSAGAPPKSDPEIYLTSPSGRQLRGWETLASGRKWRDQFWLLLRPGKAGALGIVWQRANWQEQMTGLDWGV